MKNIQPILDWLKKSWVGKPVYEFWRMFFNDDTGISMRKALAFYLFIVAGDLIKDHTDKSNLEWVLGEVFFTALALLGIVTYANYKSRNTSTDEGK